MRVDPVLGPKMKPQSRFHMAVDGVALESKLVMMQANEGERRRREAAQQQACAPQQQQSQQPQQLQGPPPQAEHSHADPQQHPHKRVRRNHGLTSLPPPISTLPRARDGMNFAPLRVGVPPYPHRASRVPMPSPMTCIGPSAQGRALHLLPLLPSPPWHRGPQPQHQAQHLPPPKPGWPRLSTPTPGSKRTKT